jgi:hypothetical protein
MAVRPREHARNEQDGRGAVDDAASSAGEFMQRRPIEAATLEAFVYIGYAERKRVTPSAHARLDLAYALPEIV